MKLSELKAKHGKLIDYGGIFIIFLIGYLFLSNAPVSADASDVILANLETSYKEREAIIKKEIDLRCGDEQAIAARKLENHFAGRDKLDAGTVEKLTVKADGRGLDCKVF